MAAQSHLVKGLAWAGVSILVWVPLFPVAKRVLPIVDAFTMGSIRYAIGIVLLVALVAALPRAAKQGVKLPESVNGKLAVRVAMGYDGLAVLHQQIGRVLAGLSAAAREKKKV